jgi:hypothetical protein
VNDLLAHGADLFGVALAEMLVLFLAADVLSASTTLPEPAKRASLNRRSLRECDGT